MSTAARHAADKAQDGRKSRRRLNTNDTHRKHFELPQPNNVGAGPGRQVPGPSVLHVSNEEIQNDMPTEELDRQVSVPTSQMQAVTVNTKFDSSKHLRNGAGD